MKIKILERVNSTILKACDCFIKKKNSSQYKNYIFTILFIKYLSDFYKQKIEILKAEYGNNEERIKRLLNKEKFKLDEKSTLNYLLSFKESENLGEQINKLLQRVEDNNRAKLEGIFQDVDFNSEAIFGPTKERNEILKKLLEDFNNESMNIENQELNSNDIISQSYEYLIAHFATTSKKEKEFFSPNGVSTLLAKLLAAREGSKIYDPTCGSGSLLIKAGYEVGNKNFRLYGQDNNRSIVSLAKMNMFLHNIHDAKIEWGDTLSNPLHLKDEKLIKFDVVIANPPFSLNMWGADIANSDKYRRFSRGIPPKSKGDYAFILHMIESLNEEGKMGIIAPHGVLFRQAVEGQIRKKLIDENLLDTIIGLPSNLFFGTFIPACILLFKKKKSTNDILFIDASHDFKKEKKQNIIDQIHIQKILNTYKTRSEIKKYSHIATFEEIQKNDYNLNISRYVDTFKQEEIEDIKITKQHISKIEKELSKVQLQMNKYLKELDL